jgi:hypothetical protein
MCHIHTHSTHDETPESLTLRSFVLQLLLDAVLGFMSMSIQLKHSNRGLHAALPTRHYNFFMFYQLFYRQPNFQPA